MLFDRNKRAFPRFGVRGTHVAVPSHWRAVLGKHEQSVAVERACFRRSSGQIESKTATGRIV